MYTVIYSRCVGVCKIRGSIGMRRWIVGGDGGVNCQSMD